MIFSYHTTAQTIYINIVFYMHMAAVKYYYGREYKLVYTITMHMTTTATRRQLFVIIVV